MRLERRTAVTVLPVAVLLLALAALTVSVVAGLGLVIPARRLTWVALTGGCWLLFAAAALLLRRVPVRAVPALVLAGALLTGLAGMTGPPNRSTDSARYNWDGIVQDAGISPYRYVPLDPALERLRPDWLFPTGRTAADGRVTCPGDRAVPVPAPSGEVVCTAINRPTVPTIYPPVAEALFAAARLAVLPSVTYLPTQVLGLLAMLGTTALLLSELRRTGRDPRWAAAFGWCPFTVGEAVTNAHIDGSATLAAVAATVLVVRGRRIAGGIALGLAIATKFTPVLIAPPISKRRPLTVAGAAVATVTAVYLPHVLTSGAAVLGYLPGYLDEEGYDSGTRSALLSAVLPAESATIVAGLLVLALAVVVLIRADPADPWASQALLVGGAILIVSPRYSWYVLLLLPFAAMSARWEWFPLIVLLQIPVLASQPWPFRGGLLVVLLIVVATHVVRRRRRRRRRRSAVSPAT